MKLCPFQILFAEKLQYLKQFRVFRVCPGLRIRLNANSLPEFFPSFRLAIGGKPDILSKEQPSF